MTLKNTTDELPSADRITEYVIIYTAYDYVAFLGWQLGG